MTWGAVIVPADPESQNEKRGCPETKPNELTAKAVTPPKTCASTNSMQHQSDWMLCKSSLPKQRSKLAKPHDLKKKDHLEMCWAQPNQVPTKTVTPQTCAITNEMKQPHTDAFAEKTAARGRHPEMGTYQLPHNEPLKGAHEGSQTQQQRQTDVCKCIHMFHTKKRKTVGREGRATMGRHGGGGRGREGGMQMKRVKGRQGRWPQTHRPARYEEGFPSLTTRPVQQRTAQRAKG